MVPTTSCRRKRISRTNGPPSAARAGALTYEPYYGLTAKPFSLSTDPRSLYKSPSHSAALEDLLSGIRRREGIVVLTGEMGTGKTTLCRAALYQLDRKTFTTFVPDPFLSREDLLRMLLVDFGEVSIDDLRRGRLSGASRPDLSYQLYEFLTSLESVDAFAVLVIDEAQHLAAPLLEEIRALVGARGWPAPVADRAGGAARAADEPQAVSDATDRTASHDALRAAAADEGRRGRIRGASARDGGWGEGADRVRVRGDRSDSRNVERRPASRQHHLRSRAVACAPGSSLGDRTAAGCRSDRRAAAGLESSRRVGSGCRAAVGQAGRARSDPPPCGRRRLRSPRRSSAAPASSPAPNRTGLFERRAVPVPGSAKAASELHALLDLATTTPETGLGSGARSGQGWCSGGPDVEVAHGERGPPRDPLHLAEECGPGVPWHGRVADCGRYRRHRAARKARFGIDRCRACDRCASGRCRSSPG